MGVFGFAPVAEGVWRLRLAFVNAYAVEHDGGWTLVDTGPPGLGWMVAIAALQKFGDVPPKAIVLTHAHFDHAGNAQALAEEWDVPIFVHAQERPYVTGESDYAPQDPTPGGAIATMSRLFPHHGVDFGERVHVFGDNGGVPSLPGWRAVHTPGHTQGHTSFFRASDRTMIVGDAFATCDMDNWIDVLGWRKRLYRPAVPFTPDWESACASLETIVGLNPEIVAVGHGLPMSGEGLAELYREMSPPPNGRYTDQPALYKPDGALLSVPPPKPDPLPKKLMVGAAVGLALVLLVGSGRKRWL